MAGDDCLECFGDVGDVIDVVELAGGNDRGQQGPVVCSDLMACEERIFPGQADRPDGVLERIGVEFETAVIEEARQSRPVIDRLADVLGERRAVGNHRELFLEPRLQRGDDGNAACVCAKGAFKRSFSSHSTAVFMRHFQHTAAVHAMQPVTSTLVRGWGCRDIRSTS